MTRFDISANQMEDSSVNYGKNGLDIEKIIGLDVVNVTKTDSYCRRWSVVEP